MEVLKIGAIAAGAWLAWQYLRPAAAAILPADWTAPDPSGAPSQTPGSTPPASAPVPPTPAQNASFGAREAAIAGAKQKGYNPNALYTFDEWDYFYRAYRGSASVDWERAAQPVYTDRAYRMTVDEWARLVTPYGVAGLRRVHAWR